MSTRKPKHHQKSTQNTTSGIAFFFEQTSLFLFHLLLVVTPFVFTAVNEELFEFGKMLVVYVFAVLVGGAWLIRMIAERRPLFRRTPLTIPILLFLASQMLSTIFSMHPRTSIFGYYTRFHGGLLSIVTYTVLYFTAINTIRKKHLPALFASLLIGLIGSSLYALPEHFGRSPSCLLITGQYDVSCWIQDVQNRVFGTFGQPNWLAAYIITILPVALAWLMVDDRSWFPKSIPPQLMRLLAGIATFLGFMVLLFTKSRSGLLGLAVSLSVLAISWLIIHRKKLPPQAKITSTWFQQRLRLLGPTFLGTCLLLALFGTPYTPSLLDQLPQLTSQTSPASPDSDAQTPTVINRLDTGGTSSGEIRKIVWEGAFDIWKRYPLFGSGVETFAYSYYQDRPLAHNTVSEWDFLYNKAHNEFLNFLATTGIVGLASYLLLLGWFGVYCLRYFNSKEKSEYVTFQAALFAGIVGLSVSNFFGFSTVMVTVLLYLYFAWAVIIGEKYIYEEVKKNQEYGWNQLLGYILVLGIVLLLLSNIYSRWNADRIFAQGKAYNRAGRVGDGAQILSQAVQLQPNEALFHDELAYTFAKVAVSTHDPAAEEIATNSARFAQGALYESDQALRLNPVHLNFYKTRARILILLSQLDPTLLTEAKQTLLVALERSPTDAKLVYNLGLIENGLDNPGEAINLLEQAIEMKPNYEAARMKLAELYETENRTAEALNQYRYVIDKIAPNNTIAQEKVATLSAQLE